MPDGVIVDGWASVIAAYSVTTVGLIIYAASLWQRRRRLERKQS